MTDELFLEIMRWAFVVFVWTSVVVLIGVALQYILWVLDKIFLFWDIFAGVSKQRAQMTRRVDVLWARHERRKEAKND